MRMSTPINHRPARLGLSVIEVLFAMGVAVIGLLGIASLIPLSSKNAADSLHMSESQALANDWYSEFTARGLNDSTNWIFFQDFGTPGLGHFSKQLGATLPARGSNPASSSGLLRELGRESVCLDPYFFAHQSVVSPSASAWSSTISRSPSNWYRPAVFPYYQDTYNPLVDSAYRTADVSGQAWDAQPRLLRVSVPTDFGSLDPMRMRGLEQAFLSTDDLSTTVRVPALDVDENDQTIPPMRVGLQNSRFASANHYSWLATICPTEPIPALSTESTIFYTVSLVVVHDRELFMTDPAITARRTGAGEPARAEEKPQGERLMWVEPVSGDFVGGNGGRVRLIGNDGTADEVRVGDWVMLSRNYAAVAVTGPTGIRPFSVHRWYRIISVEQAQAETLLTTPPLPYQKGMLEQVTAGAVRYDPYGHDTRSSWPNQLWGREVVLEGPDWSFPTAIPVSGTATTIPVPTTATLVKGVKTVIERVITVY